MNNLQPKLNIITDILKSLNIEYKLDNKSSDRSIVSIEIIDHNLKSILVGERHLNFNTKCGDDVVIPLVDFSEESYEAYQLLICDILQNQGDSSDQYEVSEEFFNLVLSLLNDIGFKTSRLDWHSVRDMLPLGMGSSNCFYINTPSHVLSLQSSGLKIRPLKNFDDWFSIPIPSNSSDYEPVKKVMFYFLSIGGLFCSSNTNLTHD